MYVSASVVRFRGETTVRNVYSSQYDSFGTSFSSCGPSSARWPIVLDDHSGYARWFLIGPLMIARLLIIAILLQVQATTEDYRVLKMIDGRRGVNSIIIYKRPAFVRSKE